MARNTQQNGCAAAEIVQVWHSPAVDLRARQRLLARALAAGRPPGMTTWADEAGDQDAAPSHSSAEELH
jgi:hypothetical protein